ncbi:hypothetical protein ACQR1W_02105 [Bradyrhizobium sp. HKCCYLS1011]|uniref:hypothetical protein n=1 Tax=Bradyrhizobium sp. HKCCYLS1011 TaxID=3420733 RepID=UPI003EBCA43C
MASSHQVGVLVSAFKAAWVDYYARPETDSTVSAEVARPALVKFLVEKAREGTTDETVLAAAGVDFLIALEAPNEPAKPTVLDAPAWHLRSTGTARFIPQGRIRLNAK